MFYALSAILRSYNDGISLGFLVLTYPEDKLINIHELLSTKGQTSNEYFIILKEKIIKM